MKGFHVRKILRVCNFKKPIVKLVTKIISRETHFNLHQESNLHCSSPHKSAKHYVMQIQALMSPLAGIKSGASVLL